MPEYTEMVSAILKKMVQLGWEEIPQAERPKMCQYETDKEPEIISTLHQALLVTLKAEELNKYTPDLGWVLSFIKSWVPNSETNRVIDVIATNLFNAAKLYSTPYSTRQYPTPIYQDGSGVQFGTVENILGKEVTHVYFPHELFTNVDKLKAELEKLPREMVELNSTASDAKAPAPSFGQGRGPGG